MGLPPQRLQLNRSLSKAWAQLLVLRSWALKLLSLDILLFFIDFYLTYLFGAQAVSNSIELIVVFTGVFLLVMMPLAKMEPYIMISILMKHPICLVMAKFYGASNLYHNDEWYFYYLQFAMLLNIALAVILMAFLSLYLAFMINFNKYSKTNNFFRLLFTLRFSFTENPPEDAD
ncbi:MAG: hypothetical protein QNL04_15410 [SAR324 cluster bacterium]|nr:hypothetical protein [SAR324 cluster bacterium]